MFGVLRWESERFRAPCVEGGGGRFAKKDRDQTYYWWVPNMLENLYTTCRSRRLLIFSCWLDLNPSTDRSTFIFGKLKNSFITYTREKGVYASIEPGPFNIDQKMEAYLSTYLSNSNAIIYNYLSHALWHTWNGVGRFVQDMSSCRLQALFMLPIFCTLLLLLPVLSVMVNCL